MTLLLHLTVQLPTHHLSYASSSSTSSSSFLKHTCNLPFHLLLLTPLPSSRCAAGSPPSISLLFSPSLSSLLLFLSIFYATSKCSSLVVQTYFRCTPPPPCCSLSFPLPIYYALILSSTSVFPLPCFCPSFSPLSSLSLSLPPALFSIVL